MFFTESTSHCGKHLSACFGIDAFVYGLTNHCAMYLSACFCYDVCDKLGFTDHWNCVYRFVRRICVFNLSANVFIVYNFRRELRTWNLKKNRVNQENYPKQKD